MITIPKKTTIYDDIDWLSKALSIDKDREVLNYACLRENKMYASDGYQLRRIAFDLDGLIDGLVSIIKTKDGFMLVNADMNGTYPDVTHLVMMGDICITKIEYSTPNGWNNDINVGLSVRLFDIITAIKQPMNFDILKSIYTKQYQLECWVSGEKDKPIVFKDDSHFALVMPIKVKEGQ